MNKVVCGPLTIGLTHFNWLLNQKKTRYKS